MQAPLPQRHRLTSLVLVLLLLLTQLASAGEASSHPPCEGDLIEQMHAADSDTPPQSDHGKPGHVCHVHVAAHGGSNLPDAPATAPPVTRFPPLVVALTSRSFSPPVPPPDA